MGNFSASLPVEAPADFLADLDATFSTAPAPDAGDSGASESSDQSTEPPVDESDASASPDAVEDAPVDDEPDEDAAADDAAAEDEQPAAEDEQPAADEPPADKPKEAELPEGFRRYERDGKKFVSAPETRWNNIYGKYQVAQAVEKTIGEPLTLEAIQERQVAYDVQVAMRDDFISADPEQQARFIANFMLYESKEALKRGEVGADPMLTMAATLPDVLKAAHPDAYTALADRSLRSSLDALYEMAAERGDENLLKSVQWIDKAKFNTFRKADEVRATVSARKTGAPAENEEVARLRAELAEREQRDAAASFQSWTGDTNKAIGSEIDQTITSMLKDSGAEAKFKQFPETLKAIREALHRAVGEGLEADSHWKRNRDIELRQAQRAVSPEARDAIRQKIVTRAKNAALRAIEGRMAEVIEEHSKKVLTGSAARHARLQGGAQHRAPGSAAAPARTAVVPSVKKTADAFLSPEDFARELNSVW